MNISIVSEVVVYHDETSCAGIENLKGHILFFVPIKTKIQYQGGLFNSNQEYIEPWSLLFRNIEAIREKFQADHKFHFSDISGKKWVKCNEAEKNSVYLGVRSLKQKETRNTLYCKLGIIYYENPKPDDIDNYGGDDKREQELRFGETILRMLLKGTVHYLYDNNHRVKILKIFTDGQPYHRKLSDYRILEKLISEARDYVEIVNDAEIIPLSSDHKRHDKNSDDYVHANMLQLADMLLGSSIHSCLKNSQIKKVSPKLGDYIEYKKGIIAYPVRKMLDKRKRGRGFLNSSHYRAFTISKAALRNNNWEFDNVMTKEIILNQSTGQICLFN